MVKIQTEMNGYRGEGIHRNWMSTTIISISFIRVQTVFQTGVNFILFLVLKSCELEGHGM